jgi:hypothetical protein
LGRRCTKQSKQKETEKQVKMSSLRRRVDFSPQLVTWCRGSCFPLLKSKWYRPEMAVCKLSYDLASSGPIFCQCFAICRPTDVKSGGHTSKLLLRTLGLDSSSEERCSAHVNSPREIPEHRLLPTMSFYSNERTQSRQPWKTALMGL